MLYILFGRDKAGITEEKASELFGKPILNWPDEEFDYLISEEHQDVTSDKRFKKIVYDIDKATVPMHNVIMDIYTGDTHDVHKVSTGVKTLWLAQIGFNVTFLSEWFGPNCYQTLFDISKDVDVYMYDNSDMFEQYNYAEIHGDFVDYLCGDVIHWNGDESLELLEERGRL